MRKSKKEKGGPMIGAALPDLVEILEVIGDPKAIPILTKLTKHKKYIVRVRAIRALGGIGNKEAMQVLISLPRNFELMS